VKHWQTVVAILATLSASMALAEDFKTTQPSIQKGERSGLPTHIATTESVSLCERMKS
jgi:hypothetical protein